MTTPFGALITYLNPLMLTFLLKLFFDRAPVNNGCLLFCHVLWLLLYFLRLGWLYFIWLFCWFALRRIILHRIIIFVYIWIRNYLISLGCIFRHCSSRVAITARTHLYPCRNVSPYMDPVVTRLAQVLFAIDTIDVYWVLCFDGFVGFQEAGRRLIRHIELSLLSTLFTLKRVHFLFFIL